LLTGSPVAVLRRLTASNAEVDRALGMERGPEAPSAADQRSVRRWLATVGNAAHDLAALWVLRHGAAPPWAESMQQIRQRGDPLTRSDLAITGTDLMALGVTGPLIGETLAGLLDRVLEEPALNTRESLLALARRMP
jgi:hypothetical protein